ERVPAPAVPARPRQALRDRAARRPRGHPRGRRRLPRRHGGRDARPRRRVGLRQVDARALHAAPGGADGRPDPLRRQGHHVPRGPRAAPAAPRDADGLPGPLLLAEPAQAGGRDRRGRPARPRRGLQGRGGPPGHDAARARRALRGPREPLSAPVLGRPAPAHRRGPRARAVPAAHRGRRARVGARRLRPGAGGQPARRDPARAQAHVRLHRPRPRRGAAGLHARRRHVPGQARRDRPRRGALRGAGPPVHRGAAVGGPGARPGRPAARPDRARGGAAEPREPAQRVPFPHPLSVCDRDLHHGAAAARRALGRAPCRLPSSAEREPDRVRHCPRGL
ncbi:MAG: Oligopeptide transport ATP-binding protein OppF, partial [uncultured Solirubrobacteraceae bacterium]